MYCPICTVRVSAHAMACGRTIVVGKEIYHKLCLIDFKLRTGEDYIHIQKEKGDAN